MDLGRVRPGSVACGIRWIWLDADATRHERVAVALGRYWCAGPWRRREEGLPLSLGSELPLPSNGMIVYGVNSICGMFLLSLEKVAPPAKWSFYMLSSTAS